MQNERILEANTLSESARDQSTNVEMIRALAVGAFFGLAWGASLRAWMVILALEFGDYPRFTWRGTFLMILLPSALLGALIGAAHHALARNGNRYWRGAILAPLLLVLAPLLFMEDFIPTLLDDGLGGGAIAVSLIGLLGGYGLSPQRTGWLRAPALLLAFTLTFAPALAMFFPGQSISDSLTERQVFAALYFAVLMIFLMAASSLPYRHDA
jgi:hypothetical protein